MVSIGAFQALDPGSNPGPRTYLIKQKMKLENSFISPEFFDIFGVFVFSYFIIISLRALKKNKPLTKKELIILLIIGILGLIVDGTIVYNKYLK